MVYQVQQGAYINASDINQLAVILSRPTGTQETGKYFLTDSSSATGATIGDYVGSLSRGSTPAGSVSIDTSDQGVTNCSTPAADFITSNGFRVSTTATGVATSVLVGGSYTINY